MDLYRYFHPHHNPRLRKVGVRLQELGELEQATQELLKAAQRAELRAENSPIENIRKENFQEIVRALSFVASSFAEMSQAHPGDSHQTMCHLAKERKGAPGWENWTQLLDQRLALIYEDEERELKIPKKALHGH